MGWDGLASDMAVIHDGGDDIYGTTMRSSALGSGHWGAERARESSSRAEKDTPELVKPDPGVIVYMRNQFALRAFQF